MVREQSDSTILSVSKPRDATAPTPSSVGLPLMEASYAERCVAAARQLHRLAEGEIILADWTMQTVLPLVTVHKLKGRERPVDGPTLVGPLLGVSPNWLTKCIQRSITVQLGTLGGIEPSSLMSDVKDFGRRTGSGICRDRSRHFSQSGRQIGRTYVSSVGAHSIEHSLRL